MFLDFKKKYFKIEVKQSRVQELVNKKLSEKHGNANETGVDIMIPFNDFE